MKRKSIAFIFGVAVLVPFVGRSDVRPSALFSDNMVIQRETLAPVWGVADVGETITVTGSWGETVATTADGSGKWMVKLKTPLAGGPHALTIKGKNTIEIRNVLSGEVWFCSGQSNMAFELKKLAKINNFRTEKRYRAAADYVKKEMETARDGMLRRFTVQGNTSLQEPLETLDGQWVASSPHSNPDFSGTAYFFGRELREALNVPVGLVISAWGATRIEPWIPAEAYQQDEEMAAYYESSMAVTEEEIAKKKASRRGWAPIRPATIFNGMVNPVIPYAIKGTIWYQGEANSGYNPHRYGRNFRAMISSWRRHWGQGDFPFYFAQLANYGSPKASSEGWPTVCDQQRRTLGLKNTGMAVLYDIGESRDVHPHNKMDVGRRLALWALKHDYPSAERRGGGKAASIVCSGPLYRSHSITDGKVVVLFDHAGSGLMTGEKPVMDAARETGEPLRFFEICGADRQWKQAQAEITGKDTVTVTHPEVPEPVSVRYGWSKNPEGANLYNKEGLPASIFTTESEVPAAGTPQVVNANMKVPAMMENPPKTWLTYHLAHPGPDRAWPGDPNPAFFWKGRYHLHYIYRDPTGFVFAHVSSDDMVHWKWHPTVLGPTTMGHGMFSGTGFFTKDGRPAMVYHGQRSNRNWIAYALDDHLDQWSKPHEMLPRDQDGNPMTRMPYFDPDIWINDGIYYGVNARSSSLPPVIMKSENLKDWDYIGELLHPEFDEEKLGVGRDEDISCPNMFKLGDNWVLLCISHKLGCRYFIGDFKDEQFLPEQHGMMNWAGWDFFAPESLLTPDGRRVMWSWCTTTTTKRSKPVERTKSLDSLKAKIQSGIQSLPRELSLSKKGSLVIKPLRELKKLRTDEKTMKDITVKSDTTHVLEGISGDTMELEIVLEAPLAREFGVKVLCDEEGNKGFTIASGMGKKTLTVDYINPPFELKEGEDLTLRVFIDKNLIEVFANDRQAAVAWHDYDPKDLHISLFSKGGDLRAREITSWQMNSIYSSLSKRKNND